MLEFKSVSSFDLVEACPSFDGISLGEAFTSPEMGEYIETHCHDGWEFQQILCMAGKNGGNAVELIFKREVPA